MSGLSGNLLFLIQRLDWYSLIDIGLVTLVFFAILSQFRGTQAAVVLRGIAILIVIVAVLSGMTRLPAFSWLLRTALPALLIALPVIFAPEIRRTLERVGRAGWLRRQRAAGELPQRVRSVVTAAQRLAERRHGALIVLERDARLDDFVETGVRLQADLSPELLLQIFYPSTPLHDGAVIIRDDMVMAAGCVVPLSSVGSLSPSPERTMGLRHRAALGISEVSDSVAVVVSEETGIISITHNGRMIRRLDGARLANLLSAFIRAPSVRSPGEWLRDRLGLPSRSPSATVEPVLPPSEGEGHGSR
jgi:diadenylate cyclase